MLNDRGSATMEYALIIIIILAAVIVLLVRFGGSVGGRYDDASEHVGKTSVSRSLEDAALNESADGSSGAGSAEGSEGSGASATRSAAADGKVRVGALEFDLQTILWLGVGILAMTALIIMKIFKAAKPDPKKKVSRA